MASEISFKVLKSQFCDENYLRIKAGYSMMCINPRAWMKVIKTADAVTEMLKQPQKPKDASMLSIQVTEFLSLSAQSISGVNYAVFHRGDTFVKLNLGQWLHMIQSFPNLNEITVQDSAMIEVMDATPLDGEIKLYSTKGLGHWFLTRDSLWLYCFDNAIVVGDELEKPFTVEKEPRDIFKALKAYMISQKIEEYNEVFCQECPLRRPSQARHSCTEKNWATQIDDYQPMATKYADKRVSTIWNDLRRELNIKNKALLSYFVSEEEISVDLLVNNMSLDFEYLFKSLLE